MAYKRDVVLTCGHCAADFVGTYKQWRNMEAAGTTPYCSSTCRFAALSNKFKRDPHNCGPCPTCKKTFTSRTKDKKYCGLSCYLASDQMKEMLLRNRVKCPSEESIGKNVAKRKMGKDVPCLECGTVFYQKRETEKTNKKKFCKTTCYRSYLAKRFDRWIANPEGLLLPQGYDEFLEKENLPCLIEGCGWSGRHLSVHANFAHGIKAADLKRAAGFNLGSGLVSKSLAELLQGREKQGIAVENPWAEKLKEAREKHFAEKKAIAYKSLEGKEHQAKAIVFRSNPGPIRVCIGCSCEFMQSTPAGKALFCSTDCRSISYEARYGRLGPKQPRARTPRGVFAK